MLRFLLVVTLFSLGSPLLAVAYICIRLAIEIRMRRKAREASVVTETIKFRHATPESLERFEGRMQESRWAVVNRGVTVE